MRESFHALAVRQLSGILAASVLTFAAVANAAPVARTADLTLNLVIRGLPGITLSATGATVIVDDSGGAMGTGQIVVPAGAITLATPVVIPVTASTAIASLTATTIDNLSGTFSIGGAAANPTELLCPPTLASGTACVRQTGLGGLMGLSGTINVWVGAVRIPVNLNFIHIGQGGNVAAPPLKFDAAPWTVQTGSVAFQTTSTYTIIGMDGLPVTVINTFTTTSTQMGTGSVSGSRITLVTPTWVDALNNLLPVFTTFTIQFVPEPGTLLLLIFSSAGLGVAGGLSSWRPKRTTRKGSVEITQPVREDDEVFRVSD